MRKLLYGHVLLLLLVLQAAAAPADNTIKIRLSIKIILDVNGNRPSGVVPARVESLLLSAFNEFVVSYWRGYRFEYTGPIIEIGGGNNPSGPSRWHHAGADSCLAIRDAAMADQRAYAWNPNAINVYITDAQGAVAVLCPFKQSDPMILVESKSAERGIDYFHEIGHYFGLCHSQGCGCGACPPNQSGLCLTEPGDDGISDTLADAPCWDADEIAQHHFGTIFANLDAANQARVLEAFENIMSYRFVRTRMTEGQLDVWADYASTMYNNVADGRTHFVAPNGSDSGTGRSTDPMDTVASGVAVANPDGSDIVLLRPGIYHETPTIDRPVTLRATRAGPVIIGVPASSPGPTGCPPIRPICCESGPDKSCLVCIPMGKRCP